MNSEKNSKNSAKNKLFLGDIITINDLREKEFNQKELTPQEHLALKNFDRFRISQLNAQKSETAFNKKYLQLQVTANLTPFEEFLKEAYFI